MIALRLLPWTIVLAFIAGAFLFDWERLPSFTSLIITALVVLLSLWFPDKR